MNKQAIATLVAFATAVGMGHIDPRLARAAGEQMGRIRGVVTEGTSTSRLAGVTVSASGPALIGPPRVVLTDNAGRYEITDLPPGVYTVEYSYPDMVSNVRKVEVRAGQAAAVNVAYTIQESGIAVINVAEQRSLTKPDSTATGSVRGANSMSRLPMGRSYQTAAQQVPGVSGGANPNIKGGQSGNNRYLIDGIDVTDPVTNTFSMNLTFDSMQSVDVLTGGMDAEYNALGGVINVVTKGGGDDFHAAVSAFVNHSRLSAGGNFGTNLWEGEQLLNDNPAGPTQRAELSLNVGGPIIKRRLWYGLTYEYDHAKSSIVRGAPLGVAPYNIQHPPQIYTGQFARLKLVFVPAAGHRLWINGNADPAVFNNTAQVNTRLGVAENRQAQGGFFTGGGWEWLMSERMILGFQAAFVYNALEVSPQGWLGSVDFVGCNQFSQTNCSYDRTRARRVNLVDNTSWYQGGSYQLDQRRRIQFDPYVALRGELLGRHTFKTGVQAQYVYRTRKAEIPGGSVFQDLGPTNTPLEAGLCNPMTGENCYRRIDTEPLNAREDGFALGFYLQDHWWTPLQWLTVNPGVRLDFGRSRDRNKRVISDLFMVSPRLGLTADLTQDGRNIVFAYYGRHTEPLSLSSASSVDAIEASKDITWQWNEMTMDYTDKVAESGGPGGVIIQKNPTMPHSDELTGGFRKEFLPNTVGSVEYTYKRITNQWSTLEVNRIWDPSGQRVVGYADPTKEGRDVLYYWTPNDYRTYQGVIFSSEGNPSERFDYGASYTLSWTSYKATSDNPRQRKFDFGFSSADLRHYVRLFGSYNLIRNVFVGAYFRYLTGTPQTKAFYNAEDADYGNWRSPSGTTPTAANDPNGIAVFRTSDQVQLDLKLSINVLPARFQHRLMFIADVFNVLNTRTATGVTADDIARFGLITGRQAPRRLQVGLTYAY
jgi:hypothetical protein